LKTFIALTTVSALPMSVMFGSNGNACMAVNLFVIS